ncbi:MAG: hypothetical protein KC912_22910 [Proteobacteria bacterium]|nr:hypothetical protein [Pseudomonadota bacterium]
MYRPAPHLLFLGLLAAIPACASRQPPEVDLGPSVIPSLSAPAPQQSTALANPPAEVETGWVGSDRATSFFDADVSLQLVSVAQDSRCPVDVVCKWAGDAEIHLIARTGGVHRERVVLHTNSRFETEAEVRGNRIRVLELAPARRADMPAVVSYSVQVEVSR